MPNNYIDSDIQRLNFRSPDLCSISCIFAVARLGFPAGASMRAQCVGGSHSNAGGTTTQTNIALELRI